MFQSYQRNVKQQRFLVLEDGTAWKVEELGWRRVYTMTGANRRSRLSNPFPHDISRPSKFDGLRDLRMGVIEGTKEKVWWSIDPRNLGYHGKVNTFVESAKDNKMHPLRIMVFVCGRDAKVTWGKYAFHTGNQDDLMYHTIPSKPVCTSHYDLMYHTILWQLTNFWSNKELQNFSSHIQGNKFYDNKMDSMCICVHEVFDFLDKQGAIFRPLTLGSNKSFYYLNSEEIESRLEEVDSRLMESKLRLDSRREKKKSKFREIKKRKKKLAKAKRRSHDAKIMRNFRF